MAEATTEETWTHTIITIDPAEKKATFIKWDSEQVDNPIAVMGENRIGGICPKGQETGLLDALLEVANMTEEERIEAQALGLQYLGDGPPTVH